MSTPKETNSVHTDSLYTHNNYIKEQEEDYILSLIEEYESFVKDVEVSGLPMWVICYYDGMPETYTKHTGDESQRH